MQSKLRFTKEKWHAPARERLLQLCAKVAWRPGRTVAWCARAHVCMQLCAHVCMQLCAHVCMQLCAHV